MSEESVEVVQKVPFAFVPNALLRGKQYKPMHRFVYTLLASYTNEDRDCYPSVATLAELAGAGKSTVIGAIAELVELGWIRVVKKREGRSFKNVYHLNVTVPVGTVKEPSTVPVGDIDGPAEPGFTVLPGTGRRTIKKEDVREEEDSSPAEPTPGLGATIPTKPVTDLFSSLYSENCAGAKFSFRQYFIFPTQALIRRHGLDSVLSVVRGYFATEWWFTKDKSNGGKRTWSYSGFLNHYDEVQSGLRQRPARTETQRKNAEAGQRLMGGVR